MKDAFKELLDLMMDSIPQEEKERMARKSTDETFDALAKVWTDDKCSPAKFCENLLTKGMDAKDIFSKAMTVTVIGALIARSLEGVSRERFQAEMRDECYRYTLSKLG